MVLPPSKRQKAQKPHSCAVFLLLQYGIFFAMQYAFCLRKTVNYFSDLFYARSNRLFRQSESVEAITASTLFAPLSELCISQPIGSFRCNYLVRAKVLFSSLSSTVLLHASQVMRSNGVWPPWLVPVPPWSVDMMISQSSCA